MCSPSDSMDANQESGNFNAKPVSTSTMKLVSSVACCKRKRSGMRVTNLVLHFAPGDHLRPPDDEVVQQHAADHGEDHAEIEAANPAHGLAADVGRERRIDVNLGGSEFFRDAGMALAAGARQIRVIDRRPRIAGGKNVVHAVATGAVGDDLRAPARRQPVIAGQIRGLAPSFDTELLREAHAFVAARAGGLGHDSAPTRENSDRVCDLME